MGFIINHSFIKSSDFLFNFLITVIPIFFNATALHSCSYCFFTGTTINLLPRKRASDGVSKPALHITQRQEARLLSNY